MRIQAETGHWEITKPQEPGAHADPSKNGPLGNDKTAGVQAGAHTEPSDEYRRSREMVEDAGKRGNAPRNRPRRVLERQKAV